MSSLIGRWGAAASLVAGILWFVIWAHQQQAHGPTEVNEMHLVAGLTWMDTSKFLVPILALVGIGLASLDGLRGRRGPRGRLGQVGRSVTFGGLAILIVVTAIEFWTFPWGSYAVTFESAGGLAGSNDAGALQALASLVFTLGVVVWSADLVRARVLPIWAAPVLVVGALLTVYLSPVFLIPGVAWLGLGFVLWSKRESAVGTRGGAL